MRWLLKKVARTAIAELAWASGWLFVSRWLPGRGDVRVLTYHRVGDAEHDPFCVSERDFDRQMAWLARRRIAVSLADLQRYLAGDGRVPPGAVLVTVDDGCPCIYDRVAPIAQRHGIPLIAFVPAGELREDGSRPPASTAADPNARISRGELRELARTGVVIGSHSYTHRSFARLPRDEARLEAEKSRAVLQSESGQPVDAFAYPFGTRADYDSASSAILREAGYRLAFTSQHGAINRRTDPFTLPRVKVEGGEGLRMFTLIARGALDGWRWVDRFLWRFQEAR
jgi:peptidoglycan/xylan/chitin deacetylase (PgdA/CDA1 family)